MSGFYPVGSHVPTYDSLLQARPGRIESASPVLALPNSELHVWATEFDSVGDELCEQYSRILSHDEQIRWRHFASPECRKNYLVSRALVRTVLSRYVGLAPAAIRFGRGEYGKPFLLTDRATSMRVQFNLSHDDKMAVIAVSKNRVGIDVENNVHPSFPEVVERFFTARENAVFMRTAMEDRTRKALECWTLKESWLKAIGTGLSIPLDTVGFDLSVAGKIMPFWTVDYYRAEWRFWIFQPDAVTTCALCTANVGVEPTIRFTKTVPLYQDHPFVMPMVSRTYHDEE